MFSKVNTFLRGSTAILLLCSLACSMDGLVNVDSPEGGMEVTRDYLKSRTGAIGLFHSSVGQLQSGISSLTYHVGLFTDELTCRLDNSHCQNRFDSRTPTIDEFGRVNMEMPGYQAFQSARINAVHSRSIMLGLEDSTLIYLIGASYAIEGYSLLFLADNLCSGIPLSDAPFEGDVRYDAGASTNYVYRKAIALFDSALSLDHDSTRYKTLARIGKGRSYLGLGIYDSAASAVNDIEESYKFALTYTLNSDPLGGVSSKYRFWTIDLSQSIQSQSIQMDNNEGGSPIAWNVQGSVTDPRVPILWDITNQASVLHQRKYTSNSLVYPLAKGVEALMIRAEHLLHKGDSGWIEVVNQARRSVSISDTTDPGTWDQQVDLLFRERAFWFFLEGNRLSDLRRLVRQYGRSAYTLYPMGTYGRDRGITPFYGTEFVFTPSSHEYSTNYMYEGCIHRNP